jgi:hypothetical protein
MEGGRGKERFAEICRAVAWVCVVASAICVLIRDRFERDVDVARRETEGIRQNLNERVPLEANSPRLVDEMAGISARNPRLRAFMVQVGFQGLPPPASGAPAP